MKRSTPLPELLAPAGSYEALRAAVDAGADAVYFGTRSCNARAFAQNFDGEELEEALAYCRLHGVRAHVTLNTLLAGPEPEGALEIAAQVWRLGADAVIAADTGLIRLLRQYLPGLAVHASTQAGIHNADGVRLFGAAGAVRAVLAREVPLADIRYAVEHTGCEIEVFLHGALCVSHSGQCLFSSLVGGRSGNRGACAQPCRLPYNGRYPLSLRDLCLAGHIPELIDSGVASLKIEGRMKSPVYVYETVSVYRRLLDERRAANAWEMERLTRAFSRQGFTDRYFVGRPSDPMTGVRTEEDKAASRAVGERTFPVRQVPVQAQVRLHAGEPAVLRMTCGERSVTVCGPVPEPARTAPLTADAVVSRLAKTGGTLFSLTAADAEADVQPGLNLSPAELNGMRRQALSLLASSDRESPVLPHPLPPAAVRPRGEFWESALFSDPAQWLALPDGEAPACSFVPLWLLPPTGRVPFGVALPPVIFDSEREEVAQMARAAVQRGVRYALVGNAGHLALCRECGLIPFGDFRLNITNPHSRRFWQDAGVSRTVLSPEVPLGAVSSLAGGVIVYGRIPLMLLERCFIRETAGGCERCGHTVLRDRRGVLFPLMRTYPHRNLLLNSVPVYMGDRQQLLRQAGAEGFHFIFTTESPAAVRQLLQRFRMQQPPEGPVRRLR